jgi:hypothetical protein
MLGMGGESGRWRVDEVRKALLFREVNERIAELLERWPSAPGDFLCECDKTGCTRRVTLVLAEYRSLRRRGVGVLDGDCVQAVSGPAAGALATSS